MSQCRKVAAASLSSLSWQPGKKRNTTVLRAARIRGADRYYAACATSARHARETQMIHVRDSRTPFWQQAVAEPAAGASPLTRDATKSCVRPTDIASLQRIGRRSCISCASHCPESSQQRCALLAIRGDSRRNPFYKFLHELQFCTSLSKQRLALRSGPRSCRVHWK